jgi:rRNA maturation endonuclease Nob1
MLWIACTAVVMIAGFYTLRPLFRESEGKIDIELLAETELDRLLDRKKVIYRNLRDLEFEHKMGRLSEADFQQLAAGYKNEAASVLERIDQLNASENLDKVIEKDIASRKAKLSGSALKRDRGQCPSCGAELISRKKFCPDCGHRL